MRVLQTLPKRRFTNTFILRYTVSKIMAVMIVPLNLFVIINNCVFKKNEFVQKLGQIVQRPINIIII